MKSRVKIRRGRTIIRLYRTSSNSTSNTSGIGEYPPAPRAPYPRSVGNRQLPFAADLRADTPSSIHANDLPCRSGSENGSRRSTGTAELLCRLSASWYSAPSLIVWWRAAGAPNDVYAFESGCGRDFCRRPGCSLLAIIGLPWSAEYEPHDTAVVHQSESSYVPFSSLRLNNKQGCRSSG